MNNFCEILAVSVFNVKSSKPAFFFLITYFCKEFDNTQTQNVYKQ